ncbi:MAG: aldehyde dehydrogenase family protein [Bacteroidia bacterium]
MSYLWIHGKPYDSDEKVPILFTYTGETLAYVEQATEKHLALLVEHLPQAQKVARTLRPYQKRDILLNLEKRLLQEAEKVADLIVHEASKPLRYARAEVQRGAVTAGIGADLARVLTEESFSLDVAPPYLGRWGLTRRFPAGPTLAITPFNFPLNLVLHKVVPAILAGNAIIIKPAPQTPLTARWLLQALLEAGTPPQMLSLVPTSNSLAEKLVTHPAIRVVSFTGSAAVGWHIQKIANRKKVILELGGNAASLVDAHTNLKEIVPALAESAFLYAGQVCISLQRIFVHETLYEDFLQAFLEATQQLHLGDPRDEKTHIGPLINRASFQRVQTWYNDASTQGATYLLKPDYFPEKCLMSPAVFGPMPENAILAREEAFAPMVEIQPFSTLYHAIEKINQSPYGLQASIYSDSYANLMYAYEHLDVGSVVFNAPPSYRIDPMPYGGVKDSGLGREGIKYAYQEMTVLRTLVG